MTRPGRAAQRGVIDAAIRDTLLEARAVYDAAVRLHTRRTQRDDEATVIAFRELGRNVTALSDAMRGVGHAFAFRIDPKGE